MEETLMKIIVIIFAIAVLINGVNFYSWAIMSVVEDYPRVHAKVKAHITLLRRIGLVAKITVYFSVVLMTFWELTRQPLIGPARSARPEGILLVALGCFFLLLDRFGPKKRAPEDDNMLKKDWPRSKFLNINFLFVAASSIFLGLLMIFLS